MAKRFGGFTPEQLGKIVPEMQGMQADEQAKFLAATPGAAARVGRMTEVAQQRVAGAVKGFADGGVVTTPVMPPVEPPVDIPSYDPTTGLPTMPDTIQGLTAAPEELTYDPADVVAGRPGGFFRRDKPSYIKLSDGTVFSTKEGSTGQEVETVLKQAEEAVKARGLQITDWGDYNEQLGQYTSLQKQEAATQAQIPYEDVFKEAQGKINETEKLISNYTRSLEALPADDPSRATLERLISEESTKLNTYVTDRTAAQAKITEQQQQKGAEQFASFKSDPKGQVEAADVAKVATDPSQLMSESTGQLTGTTPTAATTTAAAPGTTAAPTAEAAPVVTAETVTDDIKSTVDKLVAATGKPSDEALAEAATMSPDALAQLGLSVEQIQQAQTVKAPDARTVQEGELISGSSVDMARVDKAVNFEAATGAPSTDATVQGQLTGLMEQFEGAEPPAWAAGAMRAATAQLAARGLGASSMAGQAIVQAAMESSLPIAMQDAQTASSFEMQNLSNRQQTALFGAQQRANFLNLEFSQDFQARVANASRISDIANMNFNAEQQIALENARMAQTVDLTNLGAANAKIMADAAAMSQVDIANLNNRQQVQVQQAQAFLQMDMANLTNEQQTNVFKTQQIANALFTDTAASNAAAQFNASSEMQVDQFYENLAATVSMFNVEQKATTDRFNAGEANAQAQFNSSLVNQREQFNASNSLLIEQANTVWAQNVATLDTAAQNQANRDEAMAMNEMSATAFSAMLQESRDLMSFAWQTGNNDADRATQLAIAKIESEDAKAAASAKRSSGFWSAAGNFASAWIAS